MGGYGFEFPCPRVIGVELTGQLRHAVEPKDVVLEILRRYGVRGGRGAVFEFYGDSVVDLTMSGRATIANMIIETGATTAIFPSDTQTREWLIQQQRENDFRPLTADPNAPYDESIRIDLSDLVPLVAAPHSPGNVLPVAELPDTPISQVCVGSSVNSSYDDLATVAAALHTQTVHPRVQMTVTPGSRQVLRTIVESGVYQDLMQAAPVCWNLSADRVWASAKPRFKVRHPCELSTGTSQDAAALQKTRSICVARQQPRQAPLPAESRIPRLGRRSNAVPLRHPTPRFTMHSSPSPFRWKRVLPLLSNEAPIWFLRHFLNRSRIVSTVAS